MLNSFCKKTQEVQNSLSENKSNRCSQGLEILGWLVQWEERKEVSIRMTGAYVRVECSKFEISWVEQFGVTGQESIYGNDRLNGKVTSFEVLDIFFMQFWICYHMGIKVTQDGEGD